MWTRHCRDQVSECRHTRHIMRSSDGFTPKQCTSHLWQQARCSLASHGLWDSGRSASDLCLMLAIVRTLLTWKYTFSILSWLSSVIGENSIHIKLSLPTSIWPTFGPLSLLDFVFHTPFGRSDDQYTSTHNMTWANTKTWCKIVTWWYLMSWCYCYPITWEWGSPGHYRSVVHSQWMVFYDVKVNMDNQLMGGSPANTTVLWTNSTKSIFFPHNTALEFIIQIKHWMQ